MEATLLKTPDIHKVDLVDDGANQEAKIMLFKRRGMNILTIFKRKPAPFKVLQENFVDLNAALGLEIESIMKSSPGDKSDEVHDAVQDYSDAIQKILFDDAVVIEKASTDEKDERIKRIKSYRDGLNKLIKELGDPDEEEPEAKPMVDETEPKETNPKETKEEMPEEAEEVDVDKSKMTPEDLDVMQRLEKKYGPVQKSNSTEMSKRIADLEDQLAIKEEMEVAKKYSDSGYDPVELAKSLVEIKKSNPDFYTKYVESLEKVKTSIDSSKLFVEIGKRGNRGTANGDVKVQINQKAEEIRKNNPNMTQAEAITKAYDENPDLLKAYEGGN